jgi:serine/threonine protein kinase
MFPSPGGARPRPEELFAGRYAVDGVLPWGGLIPYYRASAEGTPLILCVLPMDLTRSLRAADDFSRLTHALGSTRARAIPRILDAGVIDGVPYLAFEETPGTLLSSVLRDRSLSSLTILGIADDVLEALQASHAQGLVHGDLTPQNIIVSRNRQNRLRARVIGTGTLPLLRHNPEASAHSARTGSGAHAVAYMAPELFGGRRFDVPVDLYAMGALLHHMAIGSPPVGWETDDGFDDMPGLPDVIRRAMAKRPSERYRDAASMRAALEWLDVESAKQSPHTQDIAPWMETSHIGSIPVPVLASSRPAPHVSSRHSAGKVLSTSGARPIPVGPTMVEERSERGERHWLQLLLLLILLGTLVLSGYWFEARRSPNEWTAPRGLPPGASDAP